jgi:xylulokinase
VWQAATSIRQAINGTNPDDPRSRRELHEWHGDATTGRPLRPAIMLWDQRAGPEVEHIGRTIDPGRLFEITGNPLAPGAYSLPTILWLKHHEPETLRSAHKLLVPGGYLVARLTGEFTIDHSRACTTLLFDIRRLEWHRPFLDALDIPDEKLPRPLPGLAPAGSVTAEAAALTGLRPGPVVAGRMDTVAASIGCGVMEPGCFVIMGTARGCDLPEARFAASRTARTPPRPVAGHRRFNGIGSSWRWMLIPSGSWIRRFAVGTERMIC